WWVDREGGQGERKRQRGQAADGGALESLEVGQLAWLAAVGGADHVVILRLRPKRRQQLVAQLERRGPAAGITVQRPLDRARERPRQVGPLVGERLGAHGQPLEQLVQGLGAKRVSAAERLVQRQRRRPHI